MSESLRRWAALACDTDFASPMDAAISYARGGLRVFPCKPENKAPIGRAVPHGFKDASRNQMVVAGWWRQYPQALIGTPTGADAGFVVFDIDVKHGDGFDTLIALGIEEFAATPMVRTRSGGMHVYFKPPEGQLISTSAGLVGPSLDWRGEGGYVILPGPASGYEWVEGTAGLPLADIPAALMPRERTEAIVGPARTCDRLGEFGKRKLFEAVERILAAPNGEQEMTLTWEVRLIGRLAGSGSIPADFAVAYLTAEIAGADGEPVPLKSHDRHRPWARNHIAHKIRSAFERGLALPFLDPEDLERMGEDGHEWW